MREERKRGRGGWKRGERRGINTKKHLLKLEMVRGKGDVTL